MYYGCCVCKGTRKDANLYRFPCSEKRRNKWLKCLNRSDLKNLSPEELSKTYVCQKHFETRFVYQRTRRSRLTSDAYPSLLKEPQDDSYSSGSPSLAITVTVEVEAVEETNEDETVTVETEPCDADEEENTERCIIYSKANNKGKRRGRSSLPVYKIDKNKVFEELDKISTATDDIADKILSMEVRNTWGFYENHVDSVMNHKISVCLRKWVAWYFSGGVKDTPVAYNCYVCSLGWWYLGPFRDHVNSNHEDIDLNIYLEIADCESAIVANVKDSRIPTIIRIHGACPKCGRDADCHKIIHRDIFLKYPCSYCVETFGTCSLWSRHMGSCWKYLDYVQTALAIDKLYTCHLCGTAREKMELIEEHYIYSHSVRSDVPAYQEGKTCPICRQLTPCLLTHPCTVKKPAGLCSWCLKRFSTVQLLKLHETFNNSPTHCTLCKETLPSKCSMVAHMADEHSKNFLLVPKCVLCMDHTVFLKESAITAHFVLWHRKKFDSRYYGLYVIIPKTCVPSNNIPLRKVATTTPNDSLTYKKKAPTNTRKITDVDTIPSDTLYQIFEICGNHVDNTDDDDSKIAEDEYVNTSSVFSASSLLCTEQIEEEIEDSSMDHEEGTTEDEMAVEFTTIAKEKVISDHDSIINYEDVLATMLGLKREEGSDEHRKVDTPGLLEDMICSNSKSSNKSVADSIAEYSALTSYFCNKKDEVDCKRCHNQFTPFKYKQHLQYCSERVYCTSCDKHYENMEQYCEHFETEHGFERYQCPICEGCNLKESFITHFKQHVIHTFAPVRSLRHTVNGSKLHIEYKCKRCLEKVGVDSELAHWEIHYSHTLCDEANSDDAKPTDKTESNKNDVVENKCDKEDIEEIIATNDSLTYKTKAPTNTPNTTDIDTSPSDTFIRIVEICGNYVDNTEDDSKIAEDEYENTSSVFSASSLLCTERIEQEIEDSSMDHEEGITGDEIAVEFETIVKEEEILLKTYNTIEHEERIKKEEMDVKFETVAKEKVISNHDLTMNYESPSDSTVEYTPTSYFNKKGVVDCKICQNQFWPLDYKLHLQYCSERVYCTSCDKHYENMEQYCDHFETEHGFKRHQCPICKDCNLKESFITHFKQHVVHTFAPVRSLRHTVNGSKLHIEYKCKRCLEKVGVDSVLAHWEVHYSHTLCDEANSDDAKPTDKTESNKNDVENKSDKEDIEKILVILQKPERLRKEPILNTINTCLICKKQCQRESALKIHLIEHLLKYALQKYYLRKTLQCPICKVNLLECNQFRQHMRDHAGLLSYSCTICKKKFGNQSNFTKHKKRVHNKNMLPCEVCGEKFKQGDQLRKHHLVHLSLGSIRCSCCNKLFVDAETHRKHLKEEELKKSTSDFSCKMCNVNCNFPTRRLKDHAKNEHMIRDDEIDCPMST